MSANDDIELITAKRRLIAGRSGHFTMETRNQIPALWQEYFSAPPQLEDVIEGAMYGVSYGMSQGGGFDYAVGVEVASEGSKLPDGYCYLSLSEGPYLVLKVFGPVAGLPQQFDRLFQELIPANGLMPREGAVFERYPDDERNTPEKMSYEIWAPVDVAT